MTLTGYGPRTALPNGYGQAASRKVVEQTNERTRHKSARGNLLPALRCRSKAEVTRNGTSHETRPATKRDIAHLEQNLVSAGSRGKRDRTRTSSTAENDEKTKKRRTANGVSETTRLSRSSRSASRFRTCSTTAGSSRSRSNSGSDRKGNLSNKLKR